MNPGKKDYIKQHSWLLSLTINIVVLGLVLVLTDISYETNDDFAVSQEIVAGYPYVGFINYYLCKALIVIQNISSDINIFILFQMVASFLAFVVLMKIYLNRSLDVFDVILASVICGAFSFNHYSCMQFTKTAALLMAAGLIWAVDNYISKRQILTFLPAFALYYTGALLRQEEMFPSLGYAGIFVFLWWLQNGREVLEKKHIGKEIGLLAIILAIIVTPYGINRLSYAKNIETEALRVGQKYQEERILVTDYPLMGYESNKEKYDAAGISDFDLYLIDRWILDYDGAASPDNLKAINEINRDYIKSQMTVSKAIKKAVRKSIEHMRRRDFVGLYIIMVLAISIYTALVYRQAWRYVFAFGILTITIFFILYYMQRVQFRALYLAEISAALWIFYSALCAKKRESQILRTFAAIALIAVVLLIVKPVMNGVDARSSINSGLVESADLMEYFDKHPDKFFVIPTTTAGMPAAYTNPLAVPTAPENVTDTGGWDTLTPYRMSCLKKCGNITNPIKGLIDNPSGIYVGRYKISMMRDYYKKWHCSNDEQVQFVKVGNVNDVELFNVVKVKN